MDFFEYAQVAEMFAPGTLWVQLLIGGLCFAIVFIFEAIALFTIATNNGIKRRWMAFIPILNTYYIGVCSQKNKCYNINAKTIGLVAAIVEAVLVVLYIVNYVAQSILINEGYLVYVEQTTIMGVTALTPHLLEDIIPQSLAWAAWIYNYLNYITGILGLLFLVAELTLLICFFQTYACRRYLLFAITSVLFPIQGILFFIVRNNRGMNYRDFMRAEQAKQYAMYQQYQQQYNRNPYNQNPYNQNPYNQNPYNTGNRSSGSGDDPFADFGGDSGNSSNRRPDDPFDDFDKH